MKPNLVFGDEPVLLADDGRPMYRRWWHVTCANRRREGAIARYLTETVENCEVVIEVHRVGSTDGPIRRERCVILNGDRTRHTFRPDGPPVHLPIYLSTDDYVPNWLDQGRTRIPPGVYITGQAFCDFGQVRSAQLPVGRYLIKVHVMCDAETVATKECSLQVASDGWPTADVIMSVSDRRASEPDLELLNIAAEVSPRLTRLENVRLWVSVDGGGMTPMRWSADSPHGDPEVALSTDVPALALLALRGQRNWAFCGTPVQSGLCYLTDWQFRQHKQPQTVISTGRHTIVVRCAWPTGQAESSFTLDVPGVGEGAITLRSAASS